MKISTKYIIFVFLIIAALLVLSIPFLNTNPYVFLAVEFLVVLSIIFSILLYRSLIKPVKLISSGIETIKDQDFSIKLNKVDQKDMDQLIDVYNRMIDQLRHERILHQEQNLFLDKLIKASPSGIIILDFDSNITELNYAAEKLLGQKRENVIGKRFSNIESGIFNELANLKDGESKTIKLSGINVIKAHKAHFMDRGSKHHFIIIEELTEEILRAEKKSYDKIIRMMSHEINNSIGAINSILNSFLTYKKQLNESDVEDFVHAINVAVERNSKLNKFMQNFADVVRIPQPAKTDCDLIKLVEDVIALMNPICSDRSIDVLFKNGERKRSLKLDVQQIEQVLVNIIKNSVESIGENGKIEIEIVDNERTELVIKDNGKGIDEGIQQQLFTPFFSTKNSGQGIGLTLIREILVNHGFKFSLNTNHEGITEFTIVF
ncbi:MAG: ATP-binding protein [Melioribacteraceae bacterium]|nr:ATP-binding protein [Melioribacteraceae bacterium]MCF8355585.1 ATP-binding protein [Melioribacteraceae bacterium]MCF8395036.1 ATP-binding protein [Melioribacteraceae bacterium]MCF8420490.1 ATP-binding protein [Melioribacteraceae bacterium]